MVLIGVISDTHGFIRSSAITGLKEGPPWLNSTTSILFMKITPASSYLLAGSGQFANLFLATSKMN